jgi:hypothetical protein
MMCYIPKSFTKMRQWAAKKGPTCNALFGLGMTALVFGSNNYSLLKERYCVNFCDYGLKKIVL